MGDIIQTLWASQVDSTAGLALQIETGNFAETDLALLQEALIANSIQDTDLFDAISFHNDTFINQRQYQAKIRKDIAALLSQSARGDYWRKALYRLGSAGLFVSRERAVENVRIMVERNRSMESSLEISGGAVRGSKKRPAIYAASDGAVGEITDWKRPEHLSDAWKLYKSVCHFWPSEDAPAMDFHAFLARYGGNSGRQRYLGELGKLAFQTYLDFLWDKTGHVEGKNKNRTFRSSLHGKPELDRLSWKYVIEKIPEWSQERIGFDVREMLDGYSKASKIRVSKEPGLLSFRLCAVSLIALEFLKARLSSGEIPTDWNRHLAHLLGVVVNVIFHPFALSLSKGAPYFSRG